MITQITGLVVSISLGVAEICLGNIINLEVFVKDNIKISVGEICQLYIVMLFSAEKGYQLYGFLDKMEKEYFLLLCNCQGIGPKLAKTLLSNFSPSLIYDIIKNENQSILETVNGVGNKKAIQIMHELKKKQNKLPIPEGSSLSLPYDDLISALKSIGYHEKQIKEMIMNVQKNISWNNQTNLVDLIQYAIKSIQ